MPWRSWFEGCEERRCGSVDGRTRKDENGSRRVPHLETVFDDASRFSFKTDVEDRLGDSNGVSARTRVKDEKMVSSTLGNGKGSGNEGEGRTRSRELPSQVDLQFQIPRRV